MKDEILQKLQSKDEKTIKQALKALCKMEYIPMRYEKAFFGIDKGILKNARSGNFLSKKFTKQKYMLTQRQVIIFVDDIISSIYNVAGEHQDFKSLGLSDELLARCDTWQAEYEKNFTYIHEFDYKDEKIFAQYKKHIKLAFELIKEIKKEVKFRYEITFDSFFGQDAKNIYYFCLDKGILRDEWGKPIFLSDICEKLGVQSDDSLEREIYELACLSQNKQMDINTLNLKEKEVAKKLENFLPDNVAFERIYFQA